MTNQFISEYHVYHILNLAGINTPKNLLLNKNMDINNCHFLEGDKAVIKGLARDLWHKSDLNAVHFCDYNQSKVFALDEEMKTRLNKEYPWIGTLITERISFQTPSGIPSEIFVSLTRVKCLPSKPAHEKNKYCN
ncbi:MAG: hypothetical protein HRT52_11950 [Colwellia sp.]|nr:hypothetical protein [Colwellia sp.]